MLRIRVPLMCLAASFTPGLVPGTFAQVDHYVQVNIPYNDPAPVQAAAPVQRARSVWDGGSEDGEGWAFTTRSAISAYGRGVRYKHTAVSNYYGYGTITWDDVVFSSPVTEVISVSLNGTVSGSYSQTTPNNNTPNLGVTGPGFGSSIWNTNGTNTGVLTGYDGVGPFDFTGSTFTVLTNTPVEITIINQTSAIVTSGGDAGQNMQRLALGSALSDGPVFNVPAGVTVNSAQAGVVNNTVVPDASLYLGSDPSIVNVGDQLDITTWNGDVGSPTLLLITAMDGNPVFLSTNLFGTIDSEGRWELGGTVPPPVTGFTLDLQTVSINALGKLVFSNAHPVVFQ